MIQIGQSDATLNTVPEEGLQMSPVLHIPNHDFIGQNPTISGGQNLTSGVNRERRDTGYDSIGSNSPHYDGFSSAKIGTSTQINENSAMPNKIAETIKVVIQPMDKKDNTLSTIEIEIGTSEFPVPTESAKSSSQCHSVIKSDIISQNRLNHPVNASYPNSVSIISNNPNHESYINYAPQNHIMSVPAKNQVPDRNFWRNQLPNPRIPQPSRNRPNGVTGFPNPSWNPSRNLVPGFPGSECVPYRNLNRNSQSSRTQNGNWIQSFPSNGLWYGYQERKELYKYGVPPYNITQSINDTFKNNVNYVNDTNISNVQIEGQRFNYAQHESSRTLEAFNPPDFVPDNEIFS